MKQVIFLLMAFLPSFCLAQVHGGFNGAFGYNSLFGQNTGISDDNGWHAGLWAEPMVSEKVGVYASVAYAQRGGTVDPNIEISGEYITLSVMPRLHVPAKSGDVKFIAAFGGYVGRFTKKAELEWDGGLSGQVGLEYSRLSIFFFAHRGVVDVSDFIAGGQRWSSVGVGMNVRIF